MGEGRKGFLLGVAAYGMWGIFPLYWPLLEPAGAIELLAHRVVWSAVVMALLVALLSRTQAVRALLASSRSRGLLLLAAIVISVNWGVFIWGVNNDHVVETSLGYFINPLLNVLLGVVLLSERLNPAQWLAISLAALGVLYLTIMSGGPPWIALTLALSFGLYGFIRKTAQIEALPGLAVETTLLAPLAIGYLVWCALAGTAAFAHEGPMVDAMLVGSGAITALPLFLFAYGARRLPYSTVGVLQYLAPTLQLATAVLLFGEPFGRERAIGFALIWAALLIYAADGLLRARRVTRA